MKRNFRVDLNRTEWPTDELMPLFNLAWDVTFKGRSQPLRPLKFYVGKCTSRWYGWHYRDDFVTFTFCDQDKFKVPTFTPNVCGNICTCWNELVVSTCAYLFAHYAGMTAKSMMYANAVDAIDAYRAKKAEIEAKIAQIKAKKAEREGLKFSRAVFKNMEESTLEFKLKKLARLEKTWNRKLALAETKLKKIARRRAALIAADKRKADKFKQGVGTVGCLAG